MQFVRQIRMVLWSISFRRKIKLLKQWEKSENEDTRTMAKMLLCILKDEEMDDG
jgi:hypothetical protein